MLKNICNVLLASGLCLSATVVSADEVGYIKHRLINQTPNECYMSVRQQYSYPIDTCLGPVAASEAKTCDGSFEPHQPNFLFYAICNGTRQRLEMDKMVFLRNTYKSESIEVTWTVNMVKKKLNISYQEQIL